ncbi:MAG: hypothetical protein JWM43_284 [Acidobacteriaceae bacterium]|nr:hypothetical protein [Acidobacteriaceae bacterium]
MLRSRIRIRPNRLDVKSDAETLLRTSQIDQRRPNHAVQHGMRMIERCSTPGQPMQELLVLMERRKQRPLSQQKIDIAGESRERIGGSVRRSELKIQIQVLAEIAQLILGERPCVALSRKHRRASRIQSPQRMHQRRELLSLWQMIEVVRILAEINEPGRRLRSGSIGGPWNYKDGIVGSALYGPFG